jgi:hypothetical protein
MSVELSSEGNFDVLDGFLELHLLENGGIQVGQTAVPFENAYISTPTLSMFANRAFVGKLFLADSRDIGAMAYYKIDGAFPFLLEGGVFNGSLPNNPQWTKRPSLALRLTMGSLEHFQTSVKAYRYPNAEKDWLFWGADISYRRKDYLLQAEVTNRYDYNALNAADENFTGAYLQSAYVFHYPSVKLFHSITPAVRWDAMTYGLTQNGIDVNRFTAGLAFGLTEQPFGSCLRINFEHYFVRNEPLELARCDDHVSDNKLTLELLLLF